MLTEIVLKDYTTFLEETKFDFKATNYKILEDTNVNKDRILKGSLLVGENASGKTQVLDSIVLLLNLLLDNSEQNYFTKKSFYTKGDKFSLKYTFNVSNSEIKYEVTFNDNSINSEKLYVNNELKLNRLNKNGQTNFGEEKDNKDINDDLSLLKLEYYNTKFNNDPILNEWFEFLKNSIYVNCLTGRIKSFNPSKITEQNIFKYAEANDETELNNLLSKFDYNSELVFIKQSLNHSKQLLSNKNLVCLRKKGTGVSLPISMESTGNQAFMNVLLPINYGVKNNCMVIVDEFSSGLHNELEEALIKYFFNNSINSQIFFTSHSTNLLDTSILRPDQIYSFKLDYKERTQIKRFSDENPRESQNIEKMYLNGVFDGMPNYNKEFKD